MKSSLSTLGLLILIINLRPTLGAAEVTNVATFDRYVISPDELFFEEDNKVIPDKTFVVLRNFRALSTLEGERFALVTVQNQLNSRKTLDPDEFVGVFADGSRRFPESFDIKIDPARTRTFILSFGTHKFRW